LERLPMDINGGLIVKADNANDNTTTQKYMDARIWL
jgi:hypothetical protein